MSEQSGWRRQHHRLLTRWPDAVPGTFGLPGAFRIAMILEVGGQAVTGLPRDGAHVDFTRRCPESSDWPPPFHPTVIHRRHILRVDTVTTRETRVFLLVFLWTFAGVHADSGQAKRPKVYKKSATFSRLGQSDLSGDYLPVEADRRSGGAMLVSSVEVRAGGETHSAEFGFAAW